MYFEKRPCKGYEDGCDETVERDKTSQYRGATFCDVCLEQRTADRKRAYGEKRTAKARSSQARIDLSELDRLLASIERQSHAALPDSSPAVKKRLEAISNSIEVARQFNYAALR